MYVEYVVDDPRLTSLDGDYYLTVGANLMNKMQTTYDKGLPRKRRVWDERNDRHFIFERSLRKAEITLDDIRDLVCFFTLKELAAILHCSISFLQNYLSNNNIFIPRKKKNIPINKQQYYKNKFLNL